ncbi:MAG TPA: crotonase/enoyl-CoA hydratase family protein [Myxococcota bacterium]|nr:crotonase/enoyl-CoA hydratase family protein [Myxococcota bacterium]
MSEIVGTTLEDRILVVRLDDGKVNALSPAVVAALGAALDRAEQEAGALLLVGREGVLSAGFDLATMRAGPEAVRALVAAGAELFLRFLDSPLPVVVACPGHALAAGALLLLCADQRVAAAGEARIGLNEVAIGMRLPIFAVEIARLRLSARHFPRATAQAEIFGPEAALEAGYLDRVVPAPALEAAARAEAARLAALPRGAFGHAKRRAFGATVAAIRESLPDDLAGLTGPTA